MIKNNSFNITAVIVTYHPDLSILSELVQKLCPQVEKIVIVDNGSTSELESWASQQTEWVSKVMLLGKNFGIAAAHNRGIEWSIKNNSSHVLLMDQDSLPASDMVEKLIAAFLLKPLGAAFGPRYLDERQNNPPPFIRIEGLNLVRCQCTTSDLLIPVDYLISSGCLIPLSVLEKVGVMREDLFIDYVDIEWGLRARHFGFQSYGCCGAHMQHHLGEEPVRLFGKVIPVHSPLRHYYHFRNAILLYKKKWAPFNWVIVDAWRLLLKYIFYSLFTQPRWQQWKMMSLGIWHGVIGRAGKK